MVRTGVSIAAALALASSCAKQPTNEHITMIDMPKPDQCFGGYTNYSSRWSDCADLAHPGNPCGWTDVKFVVEPGKNGTLDVYAVRAATLARLSPIVLLPEGAALPESDFGRVIGPNERTVYRNLNADRLPGVLQESMSKFGPAGLPVTEMCAELHASQRIQFRDVSRVHEELEKFGVRRTILPEVEAID